MKKKTFKALIIIVACFFFQLRVSAGDVSIVTNNRIITDFFIGVTICYIRLSEIKSTILDYNRNGRLRPGSPGNNSAGEYRVNNVF